MTWPRVSLRDVSTTGPQYGANRSAVRPTGRGVRYVRITDIDEAGRLRPDSYVEADGELTDDYLLAEGDLLFARSGATVGKTYLHRVANGKCAFAGYLIRFRPDRSLVCPSYLSYYCQTNEYLNWVQGKKRVAAQPNINGAEYASLKLPLPTLKEQSRIVEILNEADRLRRLRSEADAKAARILPTLFLRMFGNPATWVRTESLERLVQIKSGGTPSKSEPEFWTGSIPWVSPKDMKCDLIDGAEDHISEAAIRQSATQLVPADSVLIVVRGMILARHVPLALTRRPVAINQDIKALVLTDDRLTPLFLFSAMGAQASRLLSDVSTAAHGTKKLDTTRLQSLPIPIPSDNELTRFSSIQAQLLALNEMRSTVAPRVDQLCALLIARAFAGQLTASWRRAHMKELLVEMERQARALNLPFLRELEAAV